LIPLQQLIYQFIVDGHRFSSAKLLLLARYDHLHKTFYTLQEQGREICGTRFHL